MPTSRTINATAVDYSYIVLGIISPDGSAHSLSDCTGPKSVDVDDGTAVEHNTT